MTDTEIIKALECCGYGIKEKCKECPLINHGEACMYKLKREAHNLIIRKKAEIEEFRRQEIVLPARACGKTALIKKSINDIRAEAIREFANKLYQKFEGHSDYHGDTILTKIICMADGQEVENAKPINVSKIKSEAIREFAEKLKESLVVDCGRVCERSSLLCGSITGYPIYEVEECIDNLVKEMVGEDK